MLVLADLRMASLFPFSPSPFPLALEHHRIRTFHKAATPPKPRVNPASNYSGMSKPRVGTGINVWTEEQRVVLRLLHTRFNFDANTRAAIFNRVFDAYLRTQGVPGGLAASVLGSQYRERTRPGRRHLWRSALRIPKSDDERAQEAELLSRIRTAAAAVGGNVASQAAPAPAPAPSPRTAYGSNTQTGRGESTSKGWKGWATLLEEDSARLAAARQRNGFDDESWDMGGYRSRTGRSTLDDRSRYAYSGIVGGVHDETELFSEAPGSDDDWEEEEERRQNRSAGNETTSQAPEAASVARLEMLHESDVTWNDTQPSLQVFVEGTLIPLASRIYQHGGQVHRVSFPGNQSVDCMICDPKFCDTCHARADTNQENKTQGLPFIHSSDTTRANGITSFQPQPKANSGNVPQCYRRNIRFQSVDSEISCPAKICPNTGCGVCTGSGYIRNPDRWASYDEKE